MFVTIQLIIQMYTGT